MLVCRRPAETRRNLETGKHHGKRFEGRIEIVDGQIIPFIRGSRLRDRAIGIGTGRAGPILLGYSCVSIETNHSAAIDRETGFVRELGLFDSVMVTMGVMIGSGIFIVPADMARNIGSAGWLLVAWGIAAVLTVAAALSYGELASMLPRAGGMYVLSA